MSERKQGIVRTWNEKRGFGIVRVGPESSLEKYFLHISNIRSGTGSPEPGLEIFFEVSSAAPKRDGDLPQAVKADIIVPDAPVDGGAR